MFFLVSKPMILIKSVACRIVLALRWSSDWSLDGLSSIIFMRAASCLKKTQFLIHDGTGILPTFARWWFQIFV